MKIENPANLEKMNKKKKLNKKPKKQKIFKEENLDDNVICWPVK